MVPIIFNFYFYFVIHIWLELQFVCYFYYMRQLGQSNWCIMSLSHHQTWFEIPKMYNIIISSHNELRIELFTVENTVINEKQINIINQNKLNISLSCLATNKLHPSKQTWQCQTTSTPTTSSSSLPSWSSLPFFSKDSPLIPSINSPSPP